MRVGLDVSILRHGVRSGTALYAYNLARALLDHTGVDELVLHTTTRESAAGAAVLDELGTSGATVVRASPPWTLSPDGLWWLPWPRTLPSELRTVDVFHAGEFFHPDPGAVPVVATVHDVTNILFPEQHTWLNRRMHARRLDWIRRHATRVITDSECTRTDLLKAGGVAPDIVETVYIAPAHRERVEADEQQRVNVLRSLGVDGRPFVLYVATLEPRKNHLRLIRAFEQLPDRLVDVRLVLAGGRGWRDRAILKAVERSSAAERIVWTGSVSAEALGILYGAARVFAYPSLYEGFGLPLLEAMAAGVPVLAGDRGSVPEIAGDAALVVDAGSVDSITTGLCRLLDDERLTSELRVRGRARQAEFSWTRTADETVRVYERAIQARST